MALTFRQYERKLQRMSSLRCGSHASYTISINHSTCAVLGCFDVKRAALHFIASHLSSQMMFGFPLQTVAANGAQKMLIFTLADCNLLVD